MGEPGLHGFYNIYSIWSSQLSVRDNCLVRMDSVASLVNLDTLNLQSNSITEIAGEDAPFYTETCALSLILVSNFKGRKVYRGYFTVEYFVNHSFWAFRGLHIFNVMYTCKCLGTTFTKIFDREVNPLYGRLCIQGCTDIYMYEQNVTARCRYSPSHQEENLETRLQD